MQQHNELDIKRATVGHAALTSALDVPAKSARLQRQEPGAQSVSAARSSVSGQFGKAVWGIAWQPQAATEVETVVEAATEPETVLATLQITIALGRNCAYDAYDRKHSTCFHLTSK